MSAPRTKRQFAGAAADPAQRQITAFFNAKTTAGSASNTTNLDGPSAITTSQVNSSPVLPAHVQANLISVGMRVRKSVPEGYKTVGSAFSLWADTNHNGGDTSTTTYTATLASAVSDGRAGSGAPVRRELLPFCGIHKVGGLAAQPEPDYIPLPQSIFSSSSGAADFDIPAEDDIPSLSSSQESAASSVTTAGGFAAIMAAAPPASTNRKRFHLGDDEPTLATADVPAVWGAPGGVWRDRREWLDGEVSPRSFTPAGWENARVMAVPRRRRKAFQAASSSLAGGAATGAGAGGAAGVMVAGDGGVSLADLGQENMMAVDDFEDADFFTYRTDMELE